MAFGGFGGGRANSTPMAEINVIPLVDIMLVLLVIFIITAPLLSHSVSIDLPKVASAVNETRAPTVQFAIDEAGQMFWDAKPVEREEMIARMAQAGRQPTPPELHLRVDRAARYEVLADVMSEASKAGLNKVGFVTDPSGAVTSRVAFPTP